MLKKKKFSIRGEKFGPFKIFINFAPNTGSALQIITILYLYLFICLTMAITKRCQKKKKCRKIWRGGLKETIKIMLIGPPQLHFIEDGIKITATDKKYYQMEN